MCCQVSGNGQALWLIHFGASALAGPYRKIIHIDMDAFFASVEQRDNPELRGKPIAVGHAEGRGVVATASYEARRFGVHSAMPSRRALELCPQLIFVPGRMDRYKEVSEQVTEIFSRYTDIIEPISIDEAFLDVTQNKRGIRLGVDVARSIKADIRRELDLVASAGVSYNKFLAKIASDWRKPDGLCTIHPDKALEFIDKLKVEHLWGVGPATAKKMHDMGIVWARDLRELSLPEMMRRFGRAGYTYYRFVRGNDDRPVSTTRERKSVGCEETYESDVREAALLRELLEALCFQLFRRIQKKAFWGGTLTIKIRFGDFSTITRSRSKDMPFASVSDILACAQELLEPHVGHPKGIRLLGLAVSNPKPDENPAQLELFDESDFYD